MSDTTDIPWRRDPAEVAPLLAGWARHAIAPDAEVTDVQPPGGNGMSSETVLFDVHRRHEEASNRYAARLAPLPSLVPVFQEYDLEAQAGCMQLVGAHTWVPVPRVLWVETDPRWLGTPFLVMNRIDGVPPSDMPPYVFGGWLMEATPEERSAIQANVVDVLVRLHELTPARNDLSFLHKAGTGSAHLGDHLDAQRRYYEWAREGGTYPLIVRALDWLEARRPPEGPAVFNWGDARIGNILFRGVEPVAVLDWEMAAVGPAEIDLAWMIFLHRFFQDMAQRYGMPGLPGFMERDDVAAAYERQSGHVVRELQWFEVFAALRFAIISVRTSARSIEYGAMKRPEEPDDLIMFRPLLEDMLEGTYWR
jgi:aminoglycoside phosphotransferase (APT) family kinase protein